MRASSSGIVSRSISTPRSARIMSTAWRRIVRLDRPRKSNFSSPSASTPCISYCVMRASEFVARWSGMRSVSGSRLMTTPAACVDALRATPSSCSAKSTTRWTAGSPSYISRSCGESVERLLEADPELVGDRLGDPVHLAVAVAQDAAHVADGGPREHRAERDDLGDVILPVLARDVRDDLVAAAVLEVHVDVRHRHAVGVEEPLERQPVVDRVDRGDAQRVRDDRPGRAAAAGGLDPLLPCEADEVGHDEEVPGVAHPEDDAELVLQALLQLGAGVAVAGHEPSLALRAQPRLHRVALGHGEGGDPRLADREAEVDHLGDPARVEERVALVREERRHLRRGLQVELGRLESHPPGRVDLVAGPHAEQDVVRLRLRLVDVVEVVRHDERQVRLGREPEELLVEPALLRQAVVLQLEEEPSLAKDLAVLAGEAPGGLPVVDLERLRDLAAEARGQPDETLGVTGQVLAVDPRLVVVAVDVRVGDEPAEVPVADVVLGEKDEVERLGVGLALLVAHRPARDVRLHADDRADPARERRLVERDGPVERPVVREAEVREPEPLRLVHEVGDPAEAVEQGELGVRVEVDEVVRADAHGREW